MFKNYFLMAFRNLKKHRTYTLINVIGLAIGLSATILILLHLQFEISYDRFHENADSIYRVCIRYLQEGRYEAESHVFTPPIGPDMKKDFPEVKDFVRMSTLRTAYLNVDNKAIRVDRIRYASPSLCEVFRFKLRSGDSGSALTDPFSIVLSEQTAGRIFGSKDPIGETIRRNGDREVVGVVKDFQFATLHNAIGPLLITNTPRRNEFDRLYRSEERFEKIFQYFSLLAVCIALLGLFSLSAYSAQQKSKEIGIRKVLGATAPQILSLFFREMIVLIIVANALACPVAIFVIQRWLGNFAYRNSISVWAFVLAFVGSMAAALMTISYQSLKAALKKPADELRSE